jgi:hypothetical protein
LKTPEPFVPAPESLQPFLSTLKKSRLYITHIDRHPWFFKRRIFTVPLLLNLSILFLLLWRVYIVLPWYGSIVLTVLGYDSSTSVDTSQHTRGQLVSILLRRTGTFVFDFVLFRFIGPWPYTFFLEKPGNPVQWRRKIGFKDEEVYVRVSRGFNQKDFLGASVQGWENPFFKVRVLRAVEEKYLKEKTGYLMMGADWDLDFDSMVTAQQIFDDGLVDKTYLNRSVFVWCGDATGWTMWQCGKETGGALVNEQSQKFAAADNEDDFMKRLAAEAEKEEERWKE